MKCPVCGKREQIILCLSVNLQPIIGDTPMYQISYPGQKEYVSPRCSDCYDKLMVKREGKRKEVSIGYG
mgnify:CR=1 FL=1